MQELTLSEISNVNGGFICPVGVVKGAEDGVVLMGLYSLGSLFSQYPMHLNTALVYGIAGGAGFAVATQSAYYLSNLLYGEDLNSN